MIETIKKYIQKHHMLAKKDKIVIGISGGADSICLLFVLLELQKEFQLSFTAVHVNHNIRGEEAEADEKFVLELCKRFQIPCIVYRENVELIAKKRKQSMEEAGRDVRIHAFEQVMKEHRCTKIALAHHKNDNAETLLMNLARGTGLKGMGGISPVNGVVIRPLLCVERSEIETYLEKIGQSYCTDTTNYENDYTRNCIRNEVIPYLEQRVNEKTVSHMAKAMELMREAYAYVEAQAEILVQKAVIKEPDGGYEMQKEKLEGVPAFLRQQLIRRLLAELSGKEKDLEAVHLELIDGLFEKQVGKTLDMPYKVMASRSYAGVKLWTKREKADEKVENIMDFANPLPIVRNGKQITYRVFDNEVKDVKPLEKTYTKWFDYDIIKGNVVVRTREEGDYIVLDSTGNKKTLKTFFVDRKIPREKREDILVVAEGSHVLWIVGYRMSYAYQIKAHTNHILEIEMNEGERYGRDS